MKLRGRTGEAELARSGECEAVAIEEFSHENLYKLAPFERIHTNDSEHLHHCTCSMALLLVLLMNCSKSQELEDLCIWQAKHHTCESKCKGYPCKIIASC